ncbi:hypothetical protein D3C81_1375690 [compost metagenome]
MFDGTAADVGEFQAFGAIRALITHRADQTGTAFAGQGKHGEEVRFIQIQVQLAVHRRAAGLDVGDVENLLIGAAGKTGVEGFAHH